MTALLKANYKIVMAPKSDRVMLKAVVKSSCMHILKTRSEKKYNFNIVWKWFISINSFLLTSILLSTNNFSTNNVNQKLCT